MAITQSDALGAGSCSAINTPFNDPNTGCDTMDKRVVTIETDPTCRVRIYVLGDEKCSHVNRLAVVDG